MAEPMPGPSGPSGLSGPSRFRRAWRDADGADWAAHVDRLSMSCGACDVTRYLHIDAPDGQRWTFVLAPDASLEGVENEALQQMVERQRA